MANKLFPKGRQGFLGGDIAFDTDSIKLVALDNTYVYDSAHDFLDDIGAGARVATSGALTTKSITDGVADADDVTFVAVPIGDTVTQLVLFQSTGVDGTSRLIAHFDTKSDGTPISVVTNGGDIAVTWSNGADRIFKL
jgi:hypothetical protein